MASDFNLVVSLHPPSFDILNVDPAGRHLLLYAAAERAAERLLCGHDERHWFVAAIADRVTTVRDAKTSLLPPGFCATLFQAIRKPLILKRRDVRVVEGARLEIALAVCDGVLQISITVAKPTT